MHQVVVHDGYCSTLTLNSRHLFSLMAPRQPRNPVTMTTVPRVMMRLAAESDGKEGDRVAKLPWDTDNHTPTPNSPHPPSWNTHRKLKTLPADLLIIVLLISQMSTSEVVWTLCVWDITQKSRLKRKSMYLTQQMQPRAMIESTGTARNELKKKCNKRCRLTMHLIHSCWFSCQTKIRRE